MLDSPNRVIEDRAGAFRLRVLLPILMAVAPVVAGAAEPPAYLYVGEPDPGGVDEAFLALGRRRGAVALRETPGQLKTERLGTRLSRALKEYEQLHLPEAIAALDEIERDATASGGDGLTQGEIVDLYAHRAAAHIALGDDAAGWDDLLRIAVLAPDRPLDAARFSPRTIESARRAAQTTRASAALTLDAQPDDATLLVDGAVAGHGRAEVRLPVGRHFVRAERAGFHGAGRLVDLAVGGTAARVELSPLSVPSVDDIAKRGALAGAHRVLAASLTAKGPHAALALQWVDVPSHRSLGRSELPLDERLTTAALTSSVDALVGAPVEPAPAAPRSRPWYRKPIVWGVTAGLLAAGAIGTGLGVGLSGRPPSGVVTHVDLGAAR